MATDRLILALDQGTTGTTVIAFDTAGAPRGRGYRELKQHYPRPGWVEHDPREIWRSVQEATIAALREAAADPRQVATVGITNQRETLVLWNPATLEPLGRAIVWQDRRTASECDRLREAGYEARVREVTGLVLDPYFTATKLRWALENVEGARSAAAGTVDSWLVACVSGGRDHVTDASNASRTLLCDIESGGWSEEMQDLFQVAGGQLPRIVSSSGAISHTDPEAFAGVDAPVSGIAGDQQAALFGQACLERGMAKNTYGTGSFVLLQTATERVRSRSGLLTTVAWLREGGLRYALEGPIFVTGASLQWLRDELGVIASSAEAGPLAESVADAGGVYLVPAFAGLGAPHWDPYARAAILGLSRGSGKAELVRAAVESMAYQTRDVLDAMLEDTREPLKELRVDGGASVMDFLCQFQADLLGIPVRRPVLTETTAAGAAYLAGLGAGIWRGEADLDALWRLDAEFEPRMSRDQADTLQAGWRRAVARSRGWIDPHNQ